MKAMSPNGILKDNFLINGTLVAANEHTIFFLLKSMCLNI